MLDLSEADAEEIIVAVQDHSLVPVIKDEPVTSHEKSKPPGSKYNDHG
jgi:hypothetical protein